MFICIIRGIVLAINIVYHDTLYTLDLKVSIALNSYCANGSVETAPDWSKITLVIEGFKYGLSLSTFAQNINNVPTVKSENFQKMFCLNTNRALNRWVGPNTR